MRWLEMSDDLYRYVTEHAHPNRDDVVDDLAAVTEERFGQLSQMNIGVDEGRFLQMLVALTGARTVVEVGTFTGMSALWLARGLPADGRLICFEISDRYLETATEAWTAAGVADRIEVRIGPAADGLAALPAERTIDLAFIDADKTGYQVYLDTILERISPNGVILVDNVLWSGRVIDPSDQSRDTVAIREFNDGVATRHDCTAVMLPIGDGVTMIRRND